MKIVDLQTTVLFKPFKRAIHDAARQIPGRDVLFIELVTDSDITGIGFLTGLSVAHGSEIHIINEIVQKSLRPMVLGEDVFTIEKLWKKMYEGTTRFGRKGAAVRALSGVDICLWDAIGKYCNVPVYKLLGGYKDKVKVYASGGFYNQKDDHEHLRDEVQKYVSDGFRSIKIKVGREFRQDIRRVEIARKTAGDEIDLLVDANEAWDWPTALRFLDAIKDYSIYWFEEPLKPDDIDGYVELSRRSSIPIGAGENEYTKWGFKDLIASKAVSVLQPDVTRVGGITEWINVAKMAQAWNMSCVPHAVQEVHISLVCAVSNAPILEYFTPDHYLQEFLSELFIMNPDLNRVEDGFVKVPGGVGLGFQINWDVAKQYVVD